MLNLVRLWHAVWIRVVSFPCYSRTKLQLSLVQQKHDVWTGPYLQHHSVGLKQGWGMRLLQATYKHVNLSIVQVYWGGIQANPPPLTPHPSLLTPHPSPLTPHPSPLTPHPSLLTPLSSHLTHHPSLLISLVNHHSSLLTLYLLPLTPSLLTPGPWPLAPHLSSPFLTDSSSQVVFRGDARSLWIHVKLHHSIFSHSPQWQLPYVGSNLSGTQNFSLSHARVMLINSPSHFITELKIHHLYSLNNYVYFHDHKYKESCKRFCKLKRLQLSLYLWSWK